MGLVHYGICATGLLHFLSHPPTLRDLICVFFSSIDKARDGYIVLTRYLANYWCDVTWQCVSFNNGIPVLVRRHLYIETPPWNPGPLRWVKINCENKSRCGNSIVFYEIQIESVLITIISLDMKTYHTVTDNGHSRQITSEGDVGLQIDIHPYMYDIHVYVGISLYEEISHCHWLWSQ